MNDEIRASERIATASIRGYYFQFLWTVLHWLELGEQECLVCEGAEDIDRHMGSRVEHESLKHVKGNLTENSTEVKEALLNFVEQYVFELRRGFRASFIFRTTAQLGDARKHPLLGSWLAGGQADPNAVFARVDGLARDCERREALAAIRYLRRFGLLGAFCDAVQWKWEELEYEGVHRELARRLREDRRFDGLSPEEFADQLTAIIIRQSSTARLALEERRVTRLGLDLIVNKTLLNKLVTNFRSRPDVRSHTLHVAQQTCGGITAIVVGRFGSASRTAERFAELRAVAQARPGAKADDILAWPLSEAVVEAIAQTDADFYAAFCSSNSIRRRTVRLRWLLWRLIALAKRRAAVSEVIVTREWERIALTERTSLRGVAISLAPEDTVHAITHVVAGAIAGRTDPATSGRWSSLTPWIYGKMRLIQDWDSGEIFTQENPLP